MLESFDYSLIHISGNAIKVSNILFALALLLIWIRYAKKITSFTTQQIRNKISNDKEVSHLLEKFALYIVYIVFILILLSVLNIPLGAFAFIGGALAIAVGLGTQTIVGNFISSIMIMLERSIKIGDLVEIEGITGVINSIGARCITVTNISNVDVMIPNSKLISGPVFNFTLSDNIIYFNVEVNIAKNHQQNLSPNEMRNLFEDVLGTLKSKYVILNSSDHNAYFTKINEDSLVFLLKICAKIENLNSENIVKNIINLEIFEKLNGYNFSVNYINMIDFKGGRDTDKDQKEAN